MAEPSRRASRLTIAGATLALVAVGFVGFAIGRSNGEAKPEGPSAAAVPSVTPPASSPVLPTVQPPLGRAELIAAASRAADAFAAGRPLSGTLPGLPGREFELRLPFGCPGATQFGAGALNAEYDGTAQALRIRVQPVSWAPEEWLPSAGGTGDGAEAADALEGFWIARPWTSSESCPSPAPPPPAGEVAPPAAEQTLGIARIFTSDSSRIGRRDGKPFEAVERIAPEALDARRGLQLRLRGKVVERPASGPVLCRGPSGTRPVCLLLVTFDELAVEDAATSTTIATWDVSSGSGQSPGP